MAIMHDAAPRPAEQSPEDAASLAGQATEQLAETGRSPVDEPPILHVTQSVSGGVATVMADLLRVQVQQGHRVFVACPPGDLAPLARAAGARVLHWRAARGPSLRTFGEMRRLRRIVRDLEPAVVHLHSSQAGSVGRLVLRGRRPTVFTPHAWSWNSLTGRGSRLTASWERLLARWTHAAACGSADEMHEGQDHGVGGRMVVIGHQMGEALVAPVHELSRDDARRRLDLPLDDEIVVCPARLARQKGQDVLLRAWRTVREEHPGARLVLVGDGPDRADVERATADLPEVDMVKWLPRSEALVWMRAADVVVCPSRYEGMALVPLEAAALGVPVVACRVQGMTSDLSPEARRLVPVEDHAALATALTETLADPRARVRGGAEARAWSRHQAERARPGLAYLGLYATLAG